MFVVHFTPMAPSKSGMYESTKDQIKYERREGLDSHLIDAVRLQDEYVGRKDDWLETIHWKKALDADVWVVHSNIPPPLTDYLREPKNDKKHVTVSILHGPVENMLLKEWAFLMKNIDEPAFTITHINSVWHHDACVVLDKNAYDVSIIYDEYDKLHYIPNSVDLERYSSDGFKWEFDNHPAIISCDVSRIEKLPVHIIFAMVKIVEKIPDARLNMFALPLVNIEFFRNLVCRSKKRHLDFDCIENYQMRTNTVAPFIRGADIGFNSNYSGIASRVHMEMMAMGVPVVSYNGDYTDYHAKIFDLNSIAEQIEKCWKDLNNPKKKLREKTIKYAHKHFDRGVHVKKYVELYEKLKEAKNG